MQKIPTIFLRDQVAKNRALARDEWNPECLWVRDREGMATLKYDGSACLVRDGKIYKRHELKEGKPRPEGWIHWNMVDPSPSGHGWVPVGDGPEDAYHREAWDNPDFRASEDGTYELVGPKVQKNPHDLALHHLWRHGASFLLKVPRDFAGIKAVLEKNRTEGLVFHHPDGRMAKIKRRDFGIPWPV